MTPRYVIVMKSEATLSTTHNCEFTDDLAALVGARRLFVHELITTPARPLWVVLGRCGADGSVAWLTTWRACA